MKSLVVGLGSMGKRRIRNLRALGAGEVTGFDVRDDRRREAEERYGIVTFGNFQQALAARPDALIISTPPDLHVPYALAAAREGIPFFCEASVLDYGYGDLVQEVARRGIVAAPSCTMRFHPSVRRIRDLVAEGVIGRVLCMTHHCGQYLPDWHPWEDYRRFYVSRRETGACREIVPFELVWLTWVLGPVHRVAAMTAKLSNLEADIDDVYQLLLEFSGGVLGHLLVDVVSRVPYRVCRFLGERGVISWDWHEQKVRCFIAGEGWQEFTEPEPISEEGYVAAENMYIEEMRRFIAAVNGEEDFGYTLEEDWRILRLLYAAEQSAQNGLHVTVEEGEQGEAAAGAK